MHMHLNPPMLSCRWRSPQSGMRCVMSNELFDIHAEHRPDAVTLATNPTAEFALDFDNLFTVSIALPLPVPVEFSHDAQDWDERDKSDGGTFIVYCLVHSQFILWATHRGQWR